MSSASLPKEMKALVIESKESKIKSIALPPLRPDYILVKVKAVALNPTDVCPQSRPVFKLK
jgi:NADPH:quinone reductase-like Zn-dependent oxidoreductase